MLLNRLFYLDYLQVTKKSVHLQCVFHSIRFKVNKGWARRSPFFLDKGGTTLFCHAVVTGVNRWKDFVVGILSVVMTKKCILVTYHNIKAEFIWLHLNEPIMNSYTNDKL